VKKKWFVIYTKFQQELKTAQQLTSVGITNYCPTVNLIKQYSDRRKKIKKPLISSYLMVHLEESDRNQVFSSPGVVRYLFFLGKPAVVRPCEIELMQNHLNGVYNEIQTNCLRVGETYRIPQGPFSGLTGKVLETDKSRVKLVLESLGMSITLKKYAA
jgi:transcription antitermination factor NusG